MCSKCKLLPYLKLGPSDIYLRQVKQRDLLNSTPSGSISLTILATKFRGMCTLGPILVCSIAHFVQY